MGAAQIGRHEVRIVEIGQRGFRVRRAGVQNGLSEGFQFREVGVSRRRREGIVDHADGIHIIALHPPRYRPHPGHVHGGGEQGKVLKSRIRKNP